MLKLCRKIIREDLKSTEARELANRMDEQWLSGDRELLLQIFDKDIRDQGSSGKGNHDRGPGE